MNAWSCQVAITPTSECGETSTRVSPRRFSTLGCRARRVPTRASARAKARSRFTLLMERPIIARIQPVQQIIGACRIAQITWDEAWGVMSRAVARGRRKVAQSIPYTGVDQKAFRKGHRYHTIACHQRSTVEFVDEERRTERLGMPNDIVRERALMVRYILAICVFRALLRQIPGARLAALAWVHSNGVGVVSRAPERGHQPNAYCGVPRSRATASRRR